MKLLVFAHTPPPHHGQSYMVQLMLEGLAQSAIRDPQSAIECFHVNARLSDGMEDIGGLRFGKIARLLGYCGQAIWLRFRHGIENFYFVPAPAKRSAILRDWIVMLLVRPFFKRTVFHWHAFGLGHWAAGAVEHPSGAHGPTLEPPINFGSTRIRESGDGRHGPGKIEKVARWLTRTLLGRADLSIVLTEYNRTDAALLQPKKIAVVPNGIPDPSPDFEENVIPLRRARLTAGRDLPPELQPSVSAAESSHLFRILFLAHCTREKGLFDTLGAVAFANARLAAVKSQVRIHLTVAGSFMSDAERAEFDRRIAEPDLSAAINHEP